MRKYFVRHDNLRRHLAEFEKRGSDVEDETLDMILGELKHSSFIIAADFEGVKQMATIERNGKRYGFLFTDMDEFNSFVPSGACGSNSCDFALYKEMVECGDVDGFILNPQSEGFIIIREIFDAIRHLPQNDYAPVDAYTSEELKIIKDSIDNIKLESFIADSSNIAKYDELFEEISNSTLLTLMVSRENLDDFAQNGVICTREHPMGFLYIDKIGGKYATVYTSEQKIANVTTPLNKYSQLVNFSQLANYTLNDDLDGIIINPNCENIMIGRDVLLEYWPLLENECNDSRLYSAIMHMFLIEEEV